MENLSGTKTYVVAEAGNNSGGDLHTTAKMITTAALLECNAIKFQAYRTEQLTGIDDKDVLRHLKKSELSSRRISILRSICKKWNIDFLVSAFDIDSINLLHSLNVKTLKIPSGQITNREYLRNACVFDRVILSTGMSTIKEITDALAILVPAHTTLLHCTSAYPAPYEDVNLRAMQTMRETFGLPVGLSDHTLGIEVPIAAAALGAVVIEKHFTLDRNMEGPDQKMSLEPNELKAMVRGIRNIEQALGDGVKEPKPSENATMKRKQK